MVVPSCLIDLERCFESCQLMILHTSISRVSFSSFPVKLTTSKLKCAFASNYGLLIFKGCENGVKYEIWLGFREKREKMVKTGLFILARYCWFCSYFVWTRVGLGYYWCKLQKLTNSNGSSRVLFVSVGKWFVFLKPGPANARISQPEVKHSSGQSSHHKSVEGMKLVFVELDQATSDLEGSATRKIVKDADRLIRLSK
ncbi:hypothetical protein RHMOL_Rhmol04G0254200 [Rhododendron molle]|uniref:Uncharacterized protein n=4 Tax=Rhododendron molle TaxID=49168 RepID=A0ACC0P5X2_RHOML|nr:hypothetical protein RHMOL_Rhmol04G0254200 [Rhododendron molle]KAI8560423.1 hypothetical protein RHMOL_Rhmol04G0254200 [Rhododendron molle]KAI8560424.1 hypothetical protein RHMOL_Rhmol04G0254200 [Rhododendron molle]KAI8560425.1 hypothetical protein RHMOL_Rhmol04G0254200 [Rhododendron molle]